MARKTYEFGSETFASKDKVRRWMGEVRRKYRAGQEISDPTHLAAVADLLQGHVDREQKIGAGVKRYFVDYAPDHPSLCFWIERVDGGVTDFAVSSCLSGIGHLNRQAFRDVVRPVISAYRYGRLVGGDTFVSDYSGGTFPAAEAHVDHTPPFDAVVAQFAENEGLFLETHLLTMSHDASSKPRWRDSTLPARFLMHHSHYPLRLVHWRENLSDIKRRSTQTPTTFGKSYCGPERDEAVV